MASRPALLLACLYAAACGAQALEAYLRKPVDAAEGVHMTGTAPWQQGSFAAVGPEYVVFTLEGPYWVGQYGPGLKDSSYTFNAGQRVGRVNSEPFTTAPAYRANNYADNWTLPVPVTVRIYDTEETSIRVGAPPVPPALR